MRAFPHRLLSMETPNCRHCGTDKYLKITEYTEGYIEDDSRRTAQGIIPRTRRVEPVAQYFCQKCGYFNGHTVPADWKPTPDPDITELQDAGVYFTGPRTKHERMENGVWRVSM